MPTPIPAPSIAYGPLMPILLVLAAAALGVLVEAFVRGPARRSIQVVLALLGLGGALVAGLSSLALPGLSTFISEFLVLVGTFQRYEVAAVFATVGIIFAALYILLMYQRTMQGPLSAAHEAMRDLRPREVLAVAPLLALMIFFGFYPKPLTDVITPAVNATMKDVGVSDPAPTQLTETARR